MIYELIKKIIENPNPYTSMDVLALQVEFFNIEGKLKPEEYEELKSMLNPVEDPTV